MGARAQSILPELVSGRGTTRQCRVVEGQFGLCLFNYGAKYSFCVTKHRCRRKPHRLDPRFLKPPVARIVASESVSTLMHFPIDFDGETRVAAEEIQDTHIAARRARLSHCAPASLWCNVLEHGPSTMLRMVPLPKTSSGRNSA